jgi:AAA+ ATPase superfamily predicted ATPase
MRDELQEWKKTCKDLQNDIHTLYKEIETAMQEKDEEISNLHSINEELKSYIDSLKTSQNSLYNGKHLSEVKKSRTLKTFLSRAQTALWFSRSFGLEIESIKVSETETGIKHNIKVEECKDTNVSHNCHGLLQDNLLCYKIPMM